MPNNTQQFGEFSDFSTLIKTPQNYDNKQKIKKLLPKLSDQEPSGGLTCGLSQIFQARFLQKGANSITAKEAQRSCLVGFSLAVYYAKLIYSNLDTITKQTETSASAVPALHQLTLETQDKMYIALFSAFYYCQQAFDASSIAKNYLGGKLNIKTENGEQRWVTGSGNYDSQDNQKNREKLNTLLQAMCNSIKLIMEQGSHKENVFLKEGNNANKEINPEPFKQYFPAQHQEKGKWVDVQG